MGAVKGAISIKDNMSAVLRSIKQEQSAFRRDVQRTRRELESTWDQRRTARLDATAANRTAQQLRQRLEPLRQKIVTAMAIKDMASDKVKAVGNKVKAVGKMIATPVVKLKDGVTAGLSKIKGQLTSLAKTVAIPVTLAATVVVGGAINQGAALEQSIGGVETLFKEDASVVKANADAAFRTAGLSANAYMEQVTSFSASLISSLSGDTAKAATVADMALIDMADNANKFGTDMESIQNAYQGFAKQNYTMLDNLKLGYGGTKEEMQRLLSDAQKLTGTKYDINNLADVYNAIHAIQENLGVTGTTANAFILGFNHNSSKEGTHRIHWQLGKISGTMVGLCDNQYGNNVNGAGYFHMNDSNTNVGGWKDSSMRKTLLGNSNSPTSPLANSLMAALPSDLRAVMKSVTKYTDNTGNASNSSGNVTATTDYLWLLAEFEVQGGRSYANQYEQNSQLQYDYYKAGNSKIAYKHTAVGTAVWWWLRSPSYNGSIYFCSVYTGGGSDYNNAYYSAALLPGFAT